MQKLRNNRLGSSKKMKMTVLALSTLIVCGTITAPVFAASVEPQFIEGNPECKDINPQWKALKVDPPASGLSTDNTLTVNIFLSFSNENEPIKFDWTSNIGVDAVIVKGGPNVNLYRYDPPTESSGDTDLQAPINPDNKKPFGISHITFCYDNGVPPENGNGEPVGGELLAIDMSSLVLAGMLLNTSWVLPLIAGIAVAVFAIRFRSYEKEGA
ncbi:MAG: hypothetical protein QXW73_01720 [Nitrososphaerales archaeon]